MTLRLVEIAAEGWDDWMGSLALSGVDPHNWTLNTLLAALEVSLQRGAEDEKKWAAEKRLLYEPPAAEKQKMAQEKAAGRQTRSRRGLTPGAASALLAAAAAQDMGAQAG